MSLTQDERMWFAKRDDLHETEKEIIEDTLTEFENMLWLSGRPVPGDDRIAALEAAMIKYIITSKEK
jgi:hypothetical protein